MDAQSKPDPGPILELLSAFRRSQCLLTSVELGVFDALSSAGGAPGGAGCTVEHLASALPPRSATSGDSTASSSPSLDGLDRLCRALCGLGLLSSPTPGSFALTPLAATYLTAGSPDAITGYTIHSQKVVWPLFGGLPDAVHSGTNVWQQRFGFPGSDIFGKLYSTPSDVLRFMSGMHSFATLSAPAVVRAHDLGWARSLLDLGGATGALAAAACEAYPELQATVVDLPGVVDTVQQHFPVPHLQQAGRLRWLAADFFAETERLPQQVDVVLLSRILHDWDADRCARLLRLAHGLLRPGGAVLVCEMLLAPDRLGPVPVLMQDLNMLCQTLGRERSAAEYGAMLEAAGFERVEGRVTGTYLDAVIARKPQA